MTLVVWVGFGCIFIVPVTLVVSASRFFPSRLGCSCYQGDDGGQSVRRRVPTDYIVDEPLWLSKLLVASRNSMVGRPFYTQPVKLDGRVKKHLNLSKGGNLVLNSKLSVRPVTSNGNSDFRKRDVGSFFPRRGDQCKQKRWEANTGKQKRREADTGIFQDDPALPFFCTHISYYTQQCGHVGAHCDPCLVNPLGWYLTTWVDCPFRVAPFPTLV